jgi:Na+:H+ antiporter, NhaC family
METPEKAPKQISLFLAFLPLMIMAALIGTLNLWMEIDLKFVLLLSALAAGMTAVYAGISVKTLLDDFADHIKKAFPAILILIAIGGLVGSWMYSGTVPYLIYYGLQIIHPNFLLVIAFVVSAIISTFTGTSWGTAATAGVAFMGIGASFGIPLEMVAGAALSGAVFGDKISPVSDTTNIAALATGISVYDHIKGMLTNVIIAGILAIVAFTVLGFYQTPSATNSTATTEILTQLDSIYTFNIAMLLPPAVVFIGGFKGYNPVLLMVSSSLLAVVIGMLSNGFSLQDGAQSMIAGFQTTMLPSEIVLSETLNNFLNRGGFDGMMTGAVLFCVLAIAFGSFLTSFGSLQRIMDLLLNGVRTKFGLITTAFGTGAILNGVSGNGMFSMLTVGQIFTPAFEKRKIPIPVLSRSMENSMTLLESLIPTHVSAIYMAATLGIGTMAYAPYAFFNILGIALFFVLVGRDLRKGKY